jgi:hypothetical protein
MWRIVDAKAVPYLEPFSLRNFEHCRNPKKSVRTTLLSVEREWVAGKRLHFDDPAFQADHGSVGPVMGA